MHKVQPGRVFQLSQFATNLAFAILAGSIPDLKVYLSIHDYSIVAQAVLMVKDIQTSIQLINNFKV